MWLLCVRVLDSSTTGRETKKQIAARGAPPMERVHVNGDRSSVPPREKIGPGTARRALTASGESFAGVWRWFAQDVCGACPTRFFSFGKLIAVVLPSHCCCAPTKPTPAHSAIAVSTDARHRMLSAQQTACVGVGCVGPSAIHKRWHDKVDIGPGTSSVGTSKV